MMSTTKRKRSGSAYGTTSASKKGRSSVSTRSYGRALHVKPEVKGVDTSIEDDPIDDVKTGNTGINALGLIQSGSGSNNRVGRKVHLKSLMVRGLLDFVSQDISVVNACRVVVLYDRAPNSATAIPNFNTIFGLLSQTGGSVTHFNSPLKYAAMSRFEVLKDYVWTPNPGASDPAVEFMQEEHEIKFYIPLNNREMVYSSNVSPQTHAQVETGLLYIIFKALNNTTGGSQSQFKVVNLNCRVRYVDA